MPAYLVKEGAMGAEGAVFTKKELSEEELKALYKHVYSAIKGFNEIPRPVRYDFKIDKAKYINQYLNRVGVRDAKYQYLG